MEKKLIQSQEVMAKEQREEAERHRAESEAAAANNRSLQRDLQQTRLELTESQAKCESISLSLFKIKKKWPQLRLNWFICWFIFSGMKSAAKKMAREADELRKELEASRTTLEGEFLFKKK